MCTCVHQCVGMESSAGACSGQRHWMPLELGIAGGCELGTEARSPARGASALNC